MLVAEPVRFGLEVRAFVRERAVQALSANVRDGQLAKMSDGTCAMAQTAEVAARALLGRLLADSAVELPPAVVIDVGAIEGRGWAVEANPAWAFRLCDADPAAVLEVLRGCVVPDGPGEAGRWLRPRADVTS